MEVCNHVTVQGRQGVRGTPEGPAGTLDTELLRFWICRGCPCWRYMKHRTYQTHATASRITHSSFACCPGKTLGSSKLEGSRLSDFDEHVSTHPVRRALLTQDSLDKLKLEERRQKLSDAADESQEFSLGLGPAEIQLSGPTINLAASHENKPLNFEVLHETEVLAVCHAQTSAEACNNCSTKVKPCNFVFTTLWFFYSVEAPLRIISSYLQSTTNSDSYKLVHAPHLVS